MFNTNPVEIDRRPLVTESDATRGRFTRPDESRI